MLVFLLYFIYFSEFVKNKDGRLTPAILPTENSAFKSVEFSAAPLTLSGGADNIIRLEQNNLGFGSDVLFLHIFSFPMPKQVISYLPETLQHHRSKR